MASLEIVLQNNTSSPNLFAHITGRTPSGAVFLLRADGQTPFSPASPSQTLQPVGANCTIAVGGPGAKRTVRIPHVFGGRIWFCTDRPLVFLLNPGPAVVEPSATNPSDPNYDADWGFCEFTFNESQLYVNISYVDMVSLPIALRLKNAAGVVRHVPGMPKGGLDAVCAQLAAQGKTDGAGWEKLVIRAPGTGRNLRALSPNAGMVLTPGLFAKYYDSYVDAVWKKYTHTDLVVNTQHPDWGDVKGRVTSDGRLTFPGVGAFARPAARDVFSCSTGPFVPEGSPTHLNIGARLAAALNRSTLLMDARQPEGEVVGTYYKEKVTNHYSRVCHAVTREGRGYAFPYDDVSPAKGVDQSGFLNDVAPRVLTVVVGGI